METVSDILRFRRFNRHIGWVHSHLSNYGIDDGCPVSIEAGKSHQIFVPQDILEELLEGAVCRKIKAVVQDPLWRNKYSHKFEVSKIKKSG